MSTRRRATPLIALGAILAAAAWGYRHWNGLTDGSITDLDLVVAAAFIALLFTAIAPYFHTDLRADSFSKNLDHEYVLTIVPAHNEDPDMFLAMLGSLLAQTRPPDRLHIVENGSGDYVPQLHAITLDWVRVNNPSFEVIYDFHPVGDKRGAQAVALRACPQATIHHTLDSDVQLGSPDSMLRGLEPFVADRKVMSNCGLLLGSNQGKSLLTRLIDVGFVGSFLNGRASHSLVNSVAVNTGGHAFYRASIMDKYVGHYLGHRIFGRKMSYGDDAMWTRYAMLEGKTLFTRDSFGYTLHPERWEHLRKQRTRWHRSWFWGNLWLLRHFNPASAVWLLTLWQFLSFVWFTVAIPLVVVVSPIVNARFGGLFFVWMVVVGYLSSMSYLTVRRPDMSSREQLFNWALSPLVVVLNFVVGWCLRYVGLFTCLKTGWDTRQQVEVGLG